MSLLRAGFVLSLSFRVRFLITSSLLLSSSLSGPKMSLLRAGFVLSSLSEPDISTTTSTISISSFFTTALSSLLNKTGSDGTRFSLELDCAGEDGSIYTNFRCLPPLIVVPLKVPGVVACKLEEMFSSGLGFVFFLGFDLGFFFLHVSVSSSYSQFKIS